MLRANSWNLVAVSTTIAISVAVRSVFTIRVTMSDSIVVSAPVEYSPLPPIARSEAKAVSKAKPEPRVIRTAASTEDVESVAVLSNIGIHTTAEAVSATTACSRPSEGDLPSDDIRCDCCVRSAPSQAERPGCGVSLDDRIRALTCQRKLSSGGVRGNGRIGRGPSKPKQARGDIRSNR